MNPKIESKSAHTPTPWNGDVERRTKSSSSDVTDWQIIDKETNTVIASFGAGELAEKNRNHALLAVNNFEDMHYALIAAEALLKIEFVKYKQEAFVDGLIAYPCIELKKVSEILARIREQEEGK